MVVCMMCVPIGTKVCINFRRYGVCEKCGRKTLVADYTPEEESEHQTTGTIPLYDCYD